MFMLTELPEMVTVFERFFQLEYSESYTCNMHSDARIDGYHYCICHLQGTAFETLLALNYNSFTLTVAIIGVGIYSIEAGEYKVFDSRSLNRGGRSIEVYFPILFYNYFGTLITGRLMKDGRLIGGHFLWRFNCIQSGMITMYA